MTENEINKLLGRVGKECFVEFYEQFADLSLSRDEVVRIILKRRPSYSREAAQTWRFYSARKIIEAGCGEDALRIVIKSRVDDKTRFKARRIISQ